jgi:hypothetical protein
MVAIEDSLGYVDGVSKVLVNLEILSFATLTEWCRRKDRVTTRKKAYRERTDIKVKRAMKIRADWKQGYKAGKKAQTDGADYGSGIAIDMPSVVVNGAPDVVRNVITPATDPIQKNKRK